MTSNDVVLSLDVNFRIKGNKPKTNVNIDRDVYLSDVIVVNINLTSLDVSSPGFVHPWLDKV